MLKVTETHELHSADEALVVYDSADGIPAEYHSGAFTSDDGKSRLYPVFVKVVPDQFYEDNFGNRMEALAVNLGDDPVQGITWDNATTWDNNTFWS